MKNDTEHKDDMNIVFEHYLKHHELVLKKLILAQKATELSMQAIQDKATTDPDSVYSVWEEVIDAFTDSGLSEEELFSIESVLGKVPRSIKQCYEGLVKNDERIQELISTINQEEYKKAFKSIKNIQEKPNPISGLTSSDYDNELKDVSRKTKLANFDSTKAKNWWE